LVDGDYATALPLSGLGAGAIAELVSGLGLGPFPGPVLERLRDHTGGNPLHIRAVLQEHGADALARSPSVPWPAPRDFAGSVLEQFAACPAPAKRLLAAAAVVGIHSQLATVRHVAAIEQPLDALQAAIDGGLVEFRCRQLAFPHPLVRAAIYHALPVAERSHLHTRAAAVVRDEVAALRHRAAAAFEEDEQLASDIEALARREVGRCAWSRAAAMFEEAAELAPCRRKADGARANAAECQLLAGDLVAARSIACRFTNGKGEDSRMRYVRGRLALARGSLEEAAAHLAAAREHCRTGKDRPLAARIAAALASVSLELLRPVEAARWAKEAIAAGNGSPLVECSLPHLAMALAAAGEAGRALELVRSEPEPGEGSGAAMASWLLARSVAHFYAGAFVDAREDAARLASTADGLAAACFPVDATTMLVLIEYRMGAWDDAARHAAEPVDAASPVNAAAVWPLAATGQWEAAEAHADCAACAARTPFELAMARVAEAAIGSARGEHERVLDAVAGLRRVGAPGAIDEPGGFWPWQGLLIESLIALGSLDEANAVLVRFEALAASRRARLAMSGAARLRGILALARGRSTEAERAFRNAREHATGLHAPFERALLDAAIGGFLRRIGKRSAAAGPLASARDGFAQLGASPYLERCEADLASVGLVRRKQGAREPSYLTPQERRIVRLVVAGKRNREVASELLVSVNTVEYHLKNVYAKLGVASRSQLILRIGDAPELSAATSQS
jgi:DNA-binding CsgD family transcriptional regulator